MCSVCQVILRHDDNIILKDLLTDSEIARSEGNLGLKCSLYNDVWISWSSAKIRVGLGTGVGENELLSADQEEEYVTKVVSVTAGEDDDDVMWKMDKYRGQCPWSNCLG